MLTSLQVLLAQLLGPDDLRSEALVTGALQCFCAAGSPAASAAAAALLRRLEPRQHALQLLEAHLADSGGAELSSADRAALCAFVGNLRTAGARSAVHQCRNKVCLPARVVLCAAQPLKQAWQSAAPPS